MPSSVELRQQRARIVEAMRAATDAAEKEDRGLSGEEQQSFDRQDQDYRDLTSRIDRQEALEQREAENSRPLHGEFERGNGSGSPDGEQSPEERSKSQRSAFMSFLRRGVPGMAPEQRALVENSDGQILVPEDLETEILRALPGLTVMRGLASKRPTDRDRVRRRSLDEVSVGWGSLETKDQTLKDSMPSKPTEDYTYIEDLYGLAKIGEDELDDSDVNLQAFVTSSFSQAIGEAEDTAFTVGKGHSSHQPVGVFASGGDVTTIDSHAASDVGTDDFLSLVYAVPAQYRKNGSFLMSSSTELAIRMLKDKDDRYLWQPSVQAGRPNTFNGYSVYNQEDVQAIADGNSVAAFGDFNAGYRVYDRSGMTLQRLDELYAESGNVGFRVRYRVGGDVVRPAALRILKVKAKA